MVFDYGKQIEDQEKQMVVKKPEKHMAASFKAYEARSVPGRGGGEIATLKEVFTVSSPLFLYIQRCSSQRHGNLAHLG